MQPRVYDGAACRLGMFRGYVEAAVDEENLVDAEFVVKSANLVHHLAWLANTPVAAVEVRPRCGIVRLRQLRNDAHAKSRAIVSAHIQQIEARRSVEARCEPALAHDNIPIVGIIAKHYARDVAVVCARLQSLDERGERLRSIARNAQVSAHIVEALGGHDAERRTTNQRCGIAQLPYALDDVAHRRQIPHRIEAALIIQIAYGHADQVRLELAYGIGNLRHRIIRKHQVEHLERVPLLVHAGGEIRQSYRHGAHHHAVHKSICLISGYKQYFHGGPPKVHHTQLSAISL